MRKLFIFIVGVFLFIPAVCAYVIDGDVSDWGVDLYGTGAADKGYLNTHLPSGGWNIDIVVEDNASSNIYGWQYVGPGYSYGSSDPASDYYKKGNTFDAEAMYFDNDKDYVYLAVITGLPEDGGKAPHNPLFMPGDIGIDIDGDGVYEFGIDIDADTDTAKLYHNLDENDWEGVYFDGVNHSPNYSSSSPWRIIEDDSKEVGDISFVYSSEQNTHYVLEARIPLDYLGLSADIGDPVTYLNIHWTMECGNDVLDLKADVNPVPEPASIIMMGLGLLSILGLRVKRRS